jgi:hypothetical protein
MPWPHMQYDGSQTAGGGTLASVLLAQRERHTSRPWHQNVNVFMEKQWVGLDLALPFRRRYTYISTGLSGSLGPMVSKLARKRSLCGDCIRAEASMTAVLRRNSNSSRHSLQ